MPAGERSEGRSGLAAFAASSASLRLRASSASLAFGRGSLCGLCVGLAFGLGFLLDKP